MIRIMRPPFAIPNILRIARVTRIGFSDLLRPCDEWHADDDFGYADVKVDFGHGEVTHKCYRHLREAETRVDAVGGKR